MSRKSRNAPTDTTGTVKLKTVMPTATQLDASSSVSKPKIVQSAASVVTKALVKKPEFLEKAIARTDIKKRDAKPAIEAALAELADLLADGNELNLPPMGKLKLVKSKDIGDGAKVLTLKLRTMKDSAGKNNEMPGVDPVPE